MSRLPDKFAVPAARRPACAPADGPPGSCRGLPERSAPATHIALDLRIRFTEPMAANGGLEGFNIRHRDSLWLKPWIVANGGQAGIECLFEQDLLAPPLQAAQKEAGAAGDGAEQAVPRQQFQPTLDEGGIQIVLGTRVITRHRFGHDDVGFADRRALVTAYL